jgi:hypothetical protein
MFHGRRNRELQYASVGRVLFEKKNQYGLCNKYIEIS